jgi:hypothetical protein
MKKQNQIAAKGSRSTPPSQPKKASRKHVRVADAIRRVPLFDMNELADMPDPAAVVEAMQPIEQPAEGEFTAVRLTKAQSATFNAREQWPTLETFLPLANAEQLGRLLGSVVISVSQTERGAARGLFTFIAIAKPTDESLSRHGIAPEDAARRTQKIEAELARRNVWLAEAMKNVNLIVAQSSPAQLVKFNRGLDLIFAMTTATPTKKRRLQRELDSICAGFSDKAKGTPAT